MHKKSGGQENQALGRSRGGFTTKLHILVDSLGNPLRFRCTKGQMHDIKMAYELLDGHAFQFLMADRGYSAQHLHDFLTMSGIEPVIPPHQLSKKPRPFDEWLYQERHLVECFINKLKHFRRVFSRFEKLVSRYLGFVQFASALIWLR